eukprot:878689-Prymnesium_polylepis.3
MSTSTEHHAELLCRGTYPLSVRAQRECGGSCVCRVCSLVSVMRMPDGGCAVAARWTPAGCGGMGVAHTMRQPLSERRSSRKAKGYGPCGAKHWVSLPTP